MFQRNRKCTAGNKLTFRIKFAFVKLFYTYAMRDNMSKPSCLVITKVLCAKQNKVSGLSTILTSFLCKATPQQTPQTATSSLYGSTAISKVSSLLKIDSQSNSICRTPLITVLCTEGLSWINIPIIIIPSVTSSQKWLGMRNKCEA